ncbi:Uncharacterised protein [Janthinobacterium lividum]|nr:hypothetical protein JANLI_41210 [Janthinobacterium lividum]STS86207.1 Uncharacterised protein [Janthinobacterium lividum]
MCHQDDNTALPKNKLGHLVEKLEQLKASVRAKVEHPFHVNQSTVICAVSSSQILPITILSRSWRRMERRPRANLSPCFSLTGICSTRGSRYSRAKGQVKKM